MRGLRGWNVATDDLQPASHQALALGVRQSAHPRAVLFYQLHARTLLSDLCLRGRLIHAQHSAFLNERKRRLELGGLDLLRSAFLGSVHRSTTPRIHQLTNPPIHSSIPVTG
jgi:hypothetical protein